MRVRAAPGDARGRAAANVVLTERYAFLPQSLADGPVSASAPLLASLVAAETPFAQHAAYQDLCAVCEDGGGGRRALLLADKRGDAYAPAMAAALAPVIAVTCAMRAALNAAERADRGVRRRRRRLRREIGFSRGGDGGRGSS